jgi:hypothetical protein
MSSYLSNEYVVVSVTNNSIFFKEIELMNVINCVVEEEYRAFWYRVLFEDSFYGPISFLQLLIAL